MQEIRRESEPSGNWQKRRDNWRGHAIDNGVETKQADDVWRLLDRSDAALLSSHVGDVVDLQQTRNLVEACRAERGEIA